jgi:WD40 repeat protein
MGRPPTRFETGNPLAVADLDVDASGRSLVIAQQSDETTPLSLGLWKLDAEASPVLEMAIVREANTYPLAARFSPDRRLLAYSDAKQQLVIADLGTGQGDRETFPLRFTKWLSFARDSERLLAGGVRTQVWDATHRAVIFTLPVATLPDDPAIVPPHCALSADGRLVAAPGIEPRRIVIFDADGGQVVHRLEQAMDDARAMMFDPTGEYLAAVSRNGGARIWRVATGEVLLPDQLSLDADYFWSVAFHPAGRHIALGLWSGFVHAIRIADGEYAEIQDEPAHQGRVNNLVFQRDGARMFSGGDDGVLVWSLAPPWE